MFVLDLIDKKILYALELNSRQSNSSISKKISVSKEVIGYRLRRLENNGVIVNYYILINMHKLGYTANRFYIRLKNIDLDKEKEITKFFINNNNYWWVHSGNSYIDLALVSWEKNLTGALDRKQEILNNFKDHIDYIQQDNYLQFYLFKRKYLLDNRIKDTPPIVYIDNKKESIDDIDTKILRILSVNARMSTVDVAKKINLTASIVKYRIKRMVDQKIILGFIPRIDLSKLGYYTYTVYLFLKDYSKKDDLIHYFEAYPNITYAYETNSKYDLEFEMDVKNYEQFKQIIDDMKQKFHNVIETYEYILWYKNHKMLYFNL